jgi:hypothetical protein
MKSIYSVFALGTALLLLASAIPLTAQEKKGPNQASPEAAAKVKPSAESESVQQLHLAHSLINYGRKNKAPEALITAARIISAHGTVELKQEPTRKSAPDAPKSETSTPAADNSPKALLAEAKKLSNNNAAVVALANSVELSRGVVGGPKSYVTTIPGLTTDSYTFTFRGGELALCSVNGIGLTRIDQYIYDQNGTLVYSQVGPGDQCLSSWVPLWTGTYTIRVVNRGLLPNVYTILTN